MVRVVYPDWYVESIDIVDSHVYPDLYVESIDMRIRTLILICMWIQSLRGHDRYVVSPAVFLIATWSHLQQS